jgi:c-di-GMP-binding flagellar brake protein YcgR
MSYSFERRKHPRYEVHEGMKIECSFDLLETGIFEAEVVNISDSGISLLTKDRLAIGQEIIIKDDISIPSHTAQVEWIENCNARHYKIGLIFMK